MGRNKTSHRGTEDAERVSEETLYDGRLMSLSACLLFFFVVSCRKPTQENLEEVKNYSFKAVIRSYEFYHSSLFNADVCVAEANANTFPTDRGQCFLHGFDFSGLSVKWRSERDLEISFECGRVTTFSNFALLSEGREVPVEFHATLHETCNETTSMPAQAE